jgi:3-phosphoshikimate 1-carboxyvinyltransferase
MSQLVIQSARSLRGSIRVPGDKSISHRTLLLGALADGITRAEGFLYSGDCWATLRCMRDLGIEIEADVDGDSLVIHGKGLRGLQAPKGSLNCERSGTTMRLLAGILAGQPFPSTLTGDSQLLRRPMRRVVDPLRRMEAEIQDDEGRAPLTIRGKHLAGYDHTLAVASAQVKSALLLAGLYASGTTTVRQPGPARDHTERLLAAMGALIRTDDLTVTINQTSSLRPLALHIPGDLSSAAFLMAASCLVPSSELAVENVGTNPTRTGFLDVLREMNADLALTKEMWDGPEPSADLTARHSKLKGTEIGGSTVVRMIDEFPILAVVATQADGQTVVRGAEELRVKESDRISSVVGELVKMGGDIEARSDGFVVRGPTQLAGTAVNSRGDHRLAMALAVAGLIAEGETTVKGAECIVDSFPGFVASLRKLGAHLELDDQKARPPRS